MIQNQDIFNNNINRYKNFIVDYNFYNVNNIKLINLLDEISNIKTLFENEYENINEFQETNCIYLTMSIYYNVICNDFNSFESLNYYIIPNSKIGILFKLGETSTNDSSVYKRLQNEMNKDHCIFTIPILVMQGNNIKDMEKRLKLKLQQQNYKLDLITKNKNEFKNYKENFVVCDEVRDFILEYCQNENFECIYNFCPKCGQDWFDIIPIEIKNEIENIFSDELLLFEYSDNLHNKQKQKIRNF